MVPVFGPLDELMGSLLDTWEQRYQFNFDRERRVAEFTRGQMRARVEEMRGGKLRITYQSGPDLESSEVCTPDEAARFVEAVLFRERLVKIPR